MTETQVVDEQSLRGQKSLSGSYEASSAAPAQVFKQMSSSPSKTAGNSGSERMDNVNLDESPRKDQQIRGRRFTNGEVIGKVRHQLVHY